jgi:hypothetical protein
LTNRPNILTTRPCPKKGYIPDGHPTGGSFFVREGAITDHLNTFLNRHVFSDYRRSLLATSDIDTTARRDQQLTALRRDIADTETKSKRLIRSLELVDEPDQELIRDINECRAELREQQAQLRDRIEHLEADDLLTPNPALIDVLPTGYTEVDQLPEPLARALHGTTTPYSARWCRSHLRCAPGAARTGSARNRTRCELRVSATVPIVRRRRRATGGGAR